MHADPMMWVAGVRALYLQALHPRAVRGVMQNSDFRRDAWGRLIRTARFVAATTYGTTESAHAAGARVRAIHARLKATDPATGALYGVDEPELLLWVHCAEIESYLHVVRRSGFPLTDAQADRYVAEQAATAAPLVGLDPRDVPADRAALAAYFELMRPELAAGPEAHGVDDFLRRPPVPLPLLPVRALLWRPLARLAYATLPPRAQALYGRSAPPDAAVTRRLRATGAVLRRIPGRVRWQLPPKHILRAMARLGPAARPSPYKLVTRLAILDGPEGTGG
ncbi:oxygenase MpaB family protein [Streptomyces sp. TS71-3]|uniref:oxygenase MpaB family protein n=1 Tax=Streptomyces sp. TS71-3 TaxID=2733862 RepID=UPI001BB3C1F0|nr:oxygenase MpaB family protein [Streptomyces sp. TS71-3]